MQVRFNRVQTFLDYLNKEERFEREQFKLTQLDSVIAKEFVPSIMDHFAKQREWISKRLLENRERVEEEFMINGEASAMAIPEEYNTEIPPTLPGI